MSEDSSQDITSLTVQLLSAYLANNTVASGDLAGLIATTRAALSAPDVADEPAAEQIYEPVVSVRKSLASRDHIISMIDGKPYKMLKRHLFTHGLTPAEYRARYNLAADYPMVAPAYSDQRREVAKNLGLGRKDTKLAEIPELPVEPADEAAKPVATRVRKPKRSADAAVAPDVASKASAVVKPEKAAKPSKGPAKPKAKTVKAKAEAPVAAAQEAEATPVAPEANAAETVAPVAKPKRIRPSKSVAAATSVENATAPEKKEKAPKKPRPAKAVAEVSAADAVPTEGEVKPAAKRRRAKPKAEIEATTEPKAPRPRRMVRAPEEASDAPS